MCQNMIARKLLRSTINLHFIYQISVGLGKVWLAEGFCLFSCSATWWSIAFSVELFPHICHPKNAKELLWTGIWWEEVSVKRFSFRALLSVSAALQEQLQVPCQKYKSSEWQRTLLHFCCTFWLLLFHPWTTVLITLNKKPWEPADLLHSLLMT